MLDRRDFVKQLLADRGDLLVVPGLGSATYDVAAAGDHPLNFYLWGAMGSAATVGLGLALAQPQRRVLVITGDGEMLMALGALATIAAKQPANLAIAVVDNEHYGETGMQASHTGEGVDLIGVAKSCGIKHAYEVTDEAGLKKLAADLSGLKETLFARVRIAADEPTRVLPSKDGVELKLRFRKAVAAAG